MIKTKQILIALAVIGAYVLHDMPVHKVSAADVCWYGTPSGFVDDAPDPYVVSGVNLEITNSTTVGGQDVREPDKIYGGYGDSSEVTGNSITFNTTLTIRDNALIYGGYSNDKAVTGNMIKITDGSFGDNIKSYGGKSFTGNSTKNKIIVSGGNFGGGNAFYGGYSEDGNVGSDTPGEGNTITVSGGTFGGYNGFYGGSAEGSGNVTGNVLTISNGVFEGIILYGGCNVSTGTVSKNTVTIIGGNFGEGYSQIYGGNSGGTAEQNTVTINGGTFGADSEIYGGNSDGTAEQNTVTINGGTFGEDSKICGGCSGGTAEQNTVTINGGYFNNAIFYGGECDTSTNNTLNLKTVINGTISEVGYFQKVNFTIPAGMDREMPMMKVSTAMDLSGITFDVQNWTDGEYITLIKNVDGAAGALSDPKFCILDIGGTKELVYYTGGEPVAKGDYTIKQGDKKWDSAATAGNYTDLNAAIHGNVDGTTLTPNNSGLSANSFSNNEIIFRRGEYSGIYLSIVGAGGTNGSDVTDNKISIYGGTFIGAGTNYIAGGWSSGSGAKGLRNTVNLYGGSITNSWVIGGFGGQHNGGVGNVENNTVNIDGVSISSSTVFGGRNRLSGNATNNTVNIKSGSIGASIQIYAGYSESGSVTGNTVNIEGGTFADGFKLYGGYTTGTSSGNTLNLKMKMNGTAAEVGCFQKMNFTLPSNITNEDVMLNTESLSVDGSDGSATVNVDAAAGLELDEGTVITLVEATNPISDNYTVDNIFGEGATPGEPGVYSTSTAKVTIDSTGTKTIKLTMLDFYSNTWYGTTAGGFTRKKGEAVAEGGILNVDGADASFAVTKFFYGGYSNGEGIEVKNNTVNVTGGEFGPGKDIYGGYSGSGPANSNTVNIEDGTFNDGYKLYGGVGTASSGNTLNLKIKMGGKAAEVGCFQIMNFTLPSDMQNGETMLKTETVTFDNTKISVDATNAVKLKTGDVITLIDADNVQGAWEAGEIVGATGAIAQDSNKLTFTIGGGGHDDDEDKDKDKAPVEGIAAAVQTVNMSADLASGEGMKSLVANTAGGGTDTFGAMSAGSSKYKTGSHVDVDGWGVIVGAGKTKEWKDGSATTYGLFFEYGKGDFDTYNGNVHGDGNSENKGVGIMARHKLSNNTYYEGNIRYGKQETEWGQSDIGSYDTDSRYYGISVGMGHIFPAGKNEIDVYGRYTYSHVGACDATVGTSEYHFDSVKSHRVRVGGKYNFGNKDSKAKPFVGLAWEREFKGESKASIAGVGEAPAPSMKGNTGILEVGCDWNVSKKWTVGLGANAYMGKRKGWDGMARVFYNF